MAQFVLITQCLLYLWSTDETIIYPWILCATPAIIQFAKFLTFSNGSVHLYLAHRLALALVMAGALVVWRTTLVGTKDESLYLQAVFTTVIASL
mgnify:FL=1|jgi:hypothetical protein